jgi:RNA polymerase sigma factor (TIGR02999 family)
VSDVTRILDAIEQGDARAADQLLPILYQELRQLAAHLPAREQPGQTLQATALVHEAYLRLVGAEPQTWQNRAHFFGAAAEAMRRILVESARRRGSLKRGGGRERQDLEEPVLAIDSPGFDVVALDDALTKFAETAPQPAELVKLRYFAGLTGKQAAEVLGISSATAARYWAYARSWLYVALKEDEGTGPA